MAAMSDGAFSLAWASNRRRSSPQYTLDQSIWFTEIGVRQDASPPPSIWRVEHFPVTNPQEGKDVTVVARVDDESSDPVTTTLMWSVDGVSQAPLQMFDDGAHGDFGAGDNVFGVSIGSFLSGTFVEYEVQAEDSDANTMIYWSRFFEVQPAWQKQNDLLLVVDARWSGDVNNASPAFQDALSAMGVSYDFWDASLLGPPDKDELALYKDSAVVYGNIDGNSWLVEEITRGQATEAIGSYLEAKGKLFISGHFIANRIYWMDWFRDYLYAQRQDCCGFNSVVGVPGDPIGDGLVFDVYADYTIRPLQPAKTIFRASQSPIPIPVPLAPAPALLASPQQRNSADSELRQTGRLAPDQNFSDPRVIEFLRNQVDSAEPRGRAETTLNASSASPRSHLDGETAALRVTTPQYRLVYFAFDFAFIQQTDARNEVMARTIRFLLNPECNGLIATIVGTPGRDIIVALEGADRIFGFGGDDVICAGPGDDVVDGGEGNDWIGGFGGNDMLTGGPGRDTVLGHQGDDLIYGGDDEDFVDGGAGHDQVAGGAGNDVVFGGSGNDSLFGNDGDDFVVAGAGNDTIVCGSGFDLANGGPGSDSADSDCELQASIP